ncbi:hypothetical protein PFLUV_G00087300 [Perca fluviatilis]|uniref:Cornifelin n=1 Tax=Perca fluviatilis TaxID=8168 RepID=A0A6A5EFP3_PERFL|nr:hypothetical protein PFLUV_G00087300 [Perca fluviatilis]
MLPVTIYTVRPPFQEPYTNLRSNGIPVKRDQLAALDCGICLCATFVPCILGCKVAQDNGDSYCLPFLPGTMIALRTSIRSKYHIDGSVCDDWVIMACLPLCGLCQMAREQKRRG